MLLNKAHIAELASVEAPVESLYDNRLYHYNKGQWTAAHGRVKNNLLYLLKRAESSAADALFIIIPHDCVVELCADDELGTSSRYYCFKLRYASSGAQHYFAATDETALEQWISVLATCTIT